MFRGPKIQLQEALPEGEGLFSYRLARPETGRSGAKGTGETGVEGHAGGL